MEWAGAWQIANVTATFIGTVGLLRLKNQRKQLSMWVLQIPYLKLLWQVARWGGGEGVRVGQAGRQVRC